MKGIIEAHEAGNVLVEKTPRARNYDEVIDVVAGRVKDTSGRISAKRLLPEAQAVGYVGSARNFRRLVAEAKATWRQGNPRGRRPAVWAPGETLMIDWSLEHAAEQRVIGRRRKFWRKQPDQPLGEVLRRKGNAPS